MNQEQLWKSCLQSAQGSSELEENEGGAVRDFLEDYSKISDWLNSVQAERSRFVDGFMLSQLADDMHRKQHVQKEMNERGRILAENLPKLKEEFQWRIKHMNSQWDSLQKILLCQSSTSLEHERLEKCPNETGWDIEWVGRWLREMETQIHPLAFNVHWAPGNIQKELVRHQGLQSEIEAKASLVHGALRHCRSQGQPSKKRVDVLEKRWIQLRLRVLEWVEHLSRIEQKEATKHLVGRVGEGTLEASNWDLSDGEVNEPLSKYPRLGSLSSLAKEGLHGRNSSEELELVHQSGQNPPIVPPLHFYAVGEGEMGQSHEAGSVYQSGTPPPNSVMEFSLDGVSNETVGLKRKIASPPPRCFQFCPQVVPPMHKNISTYYFKHSDTEAEGTHAHEQRNPSGDSDSEFHDVGNVGNKDKMGSTPSPPGSREAQTLDKKWKCQKSLEFSQHTKMNLVGECGSSPSQDLVFQFSQQLEEMDHETTAALQNLDEIEELVQKAELLVKGGRKRQRASTGPSFGMDLDCWGMSEGSFFPLFKDNSASLLNKLAKASAAIETREEPMRSCPCRMDMEEVGAVGGFCVCGAGNETSAQSAAGAKIPRKHARVRKWVRAHNNSTIINQQKGTSSCDASGESASESESDVSEGSIDDPQLSSDDPTILTASTTLLQHLQHPVPPPGFLCSSPKRGSSYGSLKSGDQFYPRNGVVLRSKKTGDAGAKQRPKSFTENSSSSQAKNSIAGFGLERLRFGKALSPIHDFNQRGSSVFVSDSALNFLEKSERESGSASPQQSNFTSDASALRDRRKGNFRRRLSKQKKRGSLDVDLEDELDHFTSNSIFGGFAEMEHQLEDIENTLPVTLKPLFKLDQIDNASLETEELPSNDQDWDSYQEKYLSEPYSEEPYDQDRTLKLLAFGEDYDQVLERADSESSSALSGFQQANTRKRRPLTFNTRSEMTESDSDREEFNHFLVQSATQLRFIDAVFRRHLDNSNPPDSPEYAEMEATCEENMNSLRLILKNVENPEDLPFDIDVKSIEDVLNSWDLLRDRISQAAKLQQIQSDLKFLRANFESIQRDLSDVDPFDSKDMNCLKSKIERIQSVLTELTGKKRKLQSVNEASVGAQIFLKDSSKDVKKQLKNLYALYEQNFQLGSYLLDKMQFLEDAWASFEQERDAFEKSLAMPCGVRVKGKKSLSSGASTDSGHGTDFSHSDSDMDEKRQKLVELRAKALDLKSFLPVGSPVLDVIDFKINEAQRDFERMEKVESVPLHLKLIFPKTKSPASNRKPGQRASKSPSSRRSVSASRLGSTCPSSNSSTPRKDSSRHWRTIRFSITFHLALMGLFAVAWFLQPRCCENINTFSFSIVPHLTHHRIPHM